MIRRATPADVDGIARVHVQAWRESLRRQLDIRVSATFGGHHDHDA